MKWTRRIANAGVCAVVTGGVALGAGNPAMAATPAAAQHHPILSTTAAAKSHHTPRQPTDPWIAGQLAAFYPSAAHRPAVFDPWVKDQLALFHLSQ